MFIKDKAKVTSCGVVYIMKRRGPRTEPYGTPYKEVCEEERVLPHLTRKERDERYDEKNPVDDSAMELESNQDDRRMRRIV